MDFILIESLIKLKFFRKLIDYLIKKLWSILENIDLDYDLYGYPTYSSAKTFIKNCVLQEIFQRKFSYTQNFF